MKNSKDKHEARMVQFPKDSVILREGELNEEMFKIIRGHGEVYAGYGTEHETLIGIIREQSCFGEFGLLLKTPAIYTVVAYDDILALRIGEEDFDDFIMENHKNIRDIMKNMANSMLTMRYQIDLLTKELEHNTRQDDRIVKEMIWQARRAMKQYIVSNQFTSITGPHPGSPDRI